MSLHTLSRKYRSWVTINSPAPFAARYSSSHSVMSVSRWLVGSSRISRSDSLISTLASATRLSCPPERVSTFCPKSRILSRERIRLARCS